jgi:hypothetical protein
MFCVSVAPCVCTPLLEFRTLKAVPKFSAYCRRPTNVGPVRPPHWAKVMLELLGPPLLFTLRVCTERLVCTKPAVWIGAFKVTEVEPLIDTEATNEVVPGCPAPVKAEAFARMLVMR